MKHDSQKPPPIPDDHAIHEIWKLNRLDIFGLIELAKAGDTDAARSLMARYCHKKRLDQEAKERGVTYPPNKQGEALEGYIIESIRLSLSTGSADAGFNLVNKRSSRPPSTFREKQKQCSIGYRVAVLIDEFPSKDKAYLIAAKEFNISVGTARRYYEKHMKI
jgi:hypothetical protein